MTCTSDLLKELGDKVRSAKETALTGPRPAQASAPSGTTLQAPGAGWWTPPAI